MSQPEYRWRQLTPEQQAELLAWRQQRGHPWHSPPHRPNFGHLRFHISAACFEHRHTIGHGPERMDAFARGLLRVFAAHASQTGICRPRQPDACLVRVAEPLPRPGRGAEHSWPAPCAWPVSRANVIRLERRGWHPRSQGVLPHRRARDTLGEALLGDAELRAPQPGTPRLRRAMDRLSVEQRFGISGADGPGRSETPLARIPAGRLRQGLGQPGDVIARCFVRS